MLRNAFKPDSAVAFALSAVTDRGSKLLIRGKREGSSGEETVLGGKVLPTSHMGKG